MTDLQPAFDESKYGVGSGTPGTQHSVGDNGPRPLPAFGDSRSTKPRPEPYKLKTWYCKIGEVEWGQLPDGSDLPMREAIARAYEEITGQEPDFIFSGWGAELTEPERAVVEDRPVVWVVVWFVVWFDPSSGDFGSLDVYASEDSARAASGNLRWADVMQYEVHP